MAIDLVSTNTTRYHSVPDHADFTLPNGDWAWITLCSPQDSAATKYIVSTGPFGGANSVNLYCYNAGSFGFATKVYNLTEAFWTGGDVTMDTWYWVYATRRSGNLYVGAVPLNGTTASESAGTAISLAYDSAIGPNIGRRTDGASTRYWHGRWSQVAFVSGTGITEAQVVELANGAPLLGMPFAPSLKFLLHGKNANDSTIVDLIGGKVATRQGTGYGTGVGEEDIRAPYIWAPEYTRGITASAIEHNLTGASSTQANAGGTGAIAQAHALAVAAFTQVNASSTGAIAPGTVNDLIGAASTQGNTSSTGAITQAHVLTFSASTQNGTSSAIAITQVHVLTGGASTQGNLGGTGAITISGDFIGAPSTQGNLSGTGQITRTQTLTGAGSIQANLSSTGAISDGIVVETALMTGIARTIRIKKPGIPAGTPEWLKTTIEILIGRRGNKIVAPEFQTLAFSATSTKAECEALYSYTNEVRTAVENILTRLDS